MRDTPNDHLRITIDAAGAEIVGVLAWVAVIVEVPIAGEVGIVVIGRRFMAATDCGVEHFQSARPQRRGRDRR